MTVAITSKAVTKPILEIVQSGKLGETTLGETMTTRQGVYQLTAIGYPEISWGNEVGITLKWVRVTDG